MKITKSIHIYHLQTGTLSYLFADDIVLIQESSEEMNDTTRGVKGNS